MHNIYTSTYFPFFILHSVLFSKERTMKDDVFKCVTIFHYSSHQHQIGKKISQSPQENPNLSSLGIRPISTKVKPHNIRTSNPVEK